MSYKNINKFRFPRDEVKGNLKPLFYAKFLII